jgi:hypothetical protein
MSRPTQIIRNLFLRIEGLFGVVFKTLFSFVRNFFGFFAKLFGLTTPDYFLESDEAQGIKQALDKKPIEAAQVNTPKAPATTFRRPNAKMDDYFLNMAREVKKK